MTETRLVRGPLDDEQLGWLAALYGPVDPHYMSLEWLRHQLVDNPFGWSLHAFVLDGAEPIGHCGVVPFRGRHGAEAAVAGKLEALVLVERARGGRLAVDLLEELYAFAHEQGIPVLFGFAPPRVTRIHVRAGCRTFPLDDPTWVLVTRPLAAARGWGLGRKAAAIGLAVVQNALLATAGTLARAAVGLWRAPSLGAPTPGDAALAHATAPPGAWTVSADEAWDWYVGGGLLQAVELPGVFGSRALVRLEDNAAGIQVVAWRARRGKLVAGLLMLAALRRIARRTGAPALRVLPWSGEGGAGDLVGVARRLGFLPRGEVELLLHNVDPAFDIPVLVNPFFYVTF